MFALRIGLLLALGLTLALAEDEVIKCPGGECVKLHLCRDGEIVTDGSNLIDIRFNPDDPCEHYLLKCCKVADNVDDSEQIIVPPPSHGEFISVPPSSGDLIQSGAQDRDGSPSGSGGPGLDGLGSGGSGSGGPGLGGAGSGGSGSSGPGFGEVEAGGPGSWSGDSGNYHAGHQQYGGGYYTGSFSSAYTQSSSSSSHTSSSSSSTSFTNNYAQIGQHGSHTSGSNTGSNVGGAYTGRPYTSSQFGSQSGSSNSGLTHGSNTHWTNPQGTFGQNHQSGSLIAGGTFQTGQGTTMSQGAGQTAGTSGTLQSSTNHGTYQSGSSSSGDSSQGQHGSNQGGGHGSIQTGSSFAPGSTNDLSASGQKGPTTKPSSGSSHGSTGHTTQKPGSFTAGGSTHSSFNQTGLSSGHGSAGHFTQQSGSQTAGGSTHSSFDQTGLSSGHGSAGHSTQQSSSQTAGGSTHSSFDQTGSSSGHGSAGHSTHQSGQGTNHGTSFTAGSTDHTQGSFEHGSSGQGSFGQGGSGGSSYDLTGVNLVAGDLYSPGHGGNTKPTGTIIPGVGTVTKDQTKDTHVGTSSGSVKQEHLSSNHHTASEGSQQNTTGHVHHSSDGCKYHTEKHSHLPGHDHSYYQIDHTTVSPIKAPHENAGCGFRNKDGVGFRITGNQDGESEYGEFPWMVAILREEKALDQIINVYQCGGSLIHPQVVLTAAHCIQNKKPNEIKVRLGEWDTQTTNEIHDHQDRNVLDIVFHEEFYKGGLFNDIGLLFLDKPVEIVETVNTICLPPQDYNFDLSRCFASGWGKDVFGKEGKYQVILKKIELPIMPFNKCQTALRETRLGYRFILNKSFICAGGEPGKDTCKGDGGSPLVCPIPGTVDRYYQAGIVAWGIGCGEKGVPGVYANVAGFRKWIDEKLTQRSIPHTFYIDA